MTTYIPADIYHRGRGDWMAYIPFLQEFVYATSKAKLEHECYRVAEETQGLRSFVLTWREC